MSRHVTTTENVRLAWSVWSLSTEEENGFDRWIAEVRRAAKADAWDEGWNAAQVVEELEGRKVWAHSVTEEGYEPNPYRQRGRWVAGVAKQHRRRAVGQ